MFKESSEDTVISFSDKKHFIESDKNGIVDIELNNEGKNCNILNNN